MWFLVQLVIFVQYGGIVEGVAQTLNIAVPPVPVWCWGLLAGVVTAVLVSRGYFRLIQGVSIALMAVFTIFTVVCVGLLQFTPYRISAAQIGEGLQFSLPVEALGPAVAAFGLTGVGASEIIAYPYWCLEKDTPPSPAPAKRPRSGRDGRGDGFASCTGMRSSRCASTRSSRVRSTCSARRCFTVRASLRADRR